MKCIKAIKSLGFVWETEDPFLFCVHHLDKYPEGNSNQGPKSSLNGRQLGQDFDMANEWKMYHGHEVPGFPEHPHRGFETVTITLDGVVDHFDSMGASGRYGYGDVQWMSAGAGCQHSEMFPLIHENKENTLHLFQIWLNLPKQSKFVEPNYKMIWKEELQKISPVKGIEMTIIAGEFHGVKAIKPTPDSWASDESNHVDIILFEMDSETEILLPKRSDTVNCNLYFYQGDKVSINGEDVSSHQQIQLNQMDVTIKNSSGKAYMLLLQGEPINEPVVQYGPFVMNTYQEIEQAYSDYQKTEFGGWPWKQSDPVFEKTQKRIAKYKDGSISYPPK